MLEEKIVDRYRLIFYDYYEPSLYEQLKLANVPIQEGRIYYRINERAEKYRGFGGDKRLLEDAKKGKVERI